MVEDEMPGVVAEYAGLFQLRRGPLRGRSLGSCRTAATRVTAVSWERCSTRSGTPPIRAPRKSCRPNLPAPNAFWPRSTPPTLSPAPRRPRPGTVPDRGAADRPGTSAEGNRDPGGDGPAAPRGGPARRQVRRQDTRHRQRCHPRRALHHLPAPQGRVRTPPRSPSRGWHCRRPTRRADRATEGTGTPPQGTTIHSGQRERRPDGISHYGTVAVGRAARGDHQVSGCCGRREPRLPPPARPGATTETRTAHGS